MQFLELRVPPALQAAIILILMSALSFLFPSFQVSIPYSTWLGAVLGIVGVCIALAGVVKFRQAQTTVDPRAPQKASQLVVNGIYKHSRNPMYLGILLLLLAWAFYLSHIFAFAVLPLFTVYMTVFQIRVEERHMLQKFDNDYALYLKRVRRWL
jgi:protein-S-isoprenylcysteine O-methyltransferase Ste14